MKGVSDHRVRVAEQRRRKMRARLIESAALVLARHGPEEAVIDHVVEEAGVARGTFYNYFASLDSLLEEVRNQMGRELVEIMRDAAEGIGDEAELLALGFHSFIDVARRYPLFLNFMARLGMRTVGPGNFVHEVGPTLVQEGIENGTFRGVTVELALDLQGAAMVLYLRRMREDRAVPPEMLVAAVLRGSGVPSDRAEEIASRPVTRVEVPEDSLIARMDKVRAEREGAPE